MELFAPPQSRLVSPLQVGSISYFHFFVIDVVDVVCNVTGAYTDASAPRPHTSDVAGMRGVTRTVDNSGGYAELRNSYGSVNLANGVASGSYGATGTAPAPRNPITSAARVGGAPAKPQTSGYVSPYFSSDASRNSSAAVKSTTSGVYARPNTTSNSTSRNRPVGAAGRYG